MPNIRLSRQQIDVLGRIPSNLRVGGQNLLVAGDAQNGKLRVHGLSVEYLAPLLPHTTASTIGIADSIDVEHIIGISTDIGISDSLALQALYSRPASTTLSLAQGAQVSAVHNLSAGNALTLGQDAYPQQPTSSTIGIDQSVSVSVVYNRTPDSTIGINDSNSTNQHTETASTPVTLDDDASYQYITSQVVSSLLTLSGVATSEIARTASNSIGISDSVTVIKVHQRSPQNFLALDDTGFAVSHPFVTHDVGITQSVVVSRIITRDVTQDIGITDEFTRTGTTRASSFSVMSGWSWVWNPVFLVWEQDWVEMTSTATVEHIIGSRPIYLSAGNTIGISHSTQYQATFNRSPSTELQLTHTLGYVYVQDTTFCDYAPSVGSTTDPDAPTPPSMTPPVIQPELYDGVQLSYPPVAPTDIVYLRGPELGNTDRFSTQRVNRESRGGTLMIFREAGWPKVKQMQFTFTGLTEAEGQDVLALVELSVGKEVKLRDWEGGEWLGIITSTQEPVVRDRDACVLTTTLDFELTDGT